MCERALNINFLEEYAVAELQCGVAADINCSAGFIGAGSGHYDRSTVVDGPLQGGGVFHGIAFRREAEFDGINETVHIRLLSSLSSFRHCP